MSHLKSPSKGEILPRLALFWTHRRSWRTTPWHWRSPRSCQWDYRGPAVCGTRVWAAGWQVEEGAPRRSRTIYWESLHLRVRCWPPRCPLNAPWSICFSSSSIPTACCCCFRRVFRRRGKKERKKLVPKKKKRNKSVPIRCYHIEVAQPVEFQKLCWRAHRTTLLASLPPFPLTHTFLPSPSPVCRLRVTSFLDGESHGELMK